MRAFLKYFLVPLVLITIAVTVIAGKRGSTSRKPPIELFPDMDRQPKLRPQTFNPMLPENLSSQPHPVGSIARGSNFEENVLNTGRETGTTNWVETNPLPIDVTMLNR